MREKFAIVTDLLLGSQSSDEVRSFRLAFQSLVYPLLLKNGRISADGKSVYRRLLEEQFDLKIAETHLMELAEMTPMPTLPLNRARSCSNFDRNGAFWMLWIDRRNPSGPSTAIPPRWVPRCE